MKILLEKILFRSDSARFFKYHELYASRPAAIVRWYCVFRCYYLQRRNAASISMTALFATRPILPHGIAGVFVSKAAVIGKNCTIHQHVIIGSNNTPGSKTNGAPVIGDGCYIGAGAKIVGGIHIGNNVKIGAGCIVAENIPNNATVVMPKARIFIKEPLSTEEFVAM